MMRYNWIELAMVGMIYMSVIVVVATLVTALLFHFLDAKSKEDEKLKNEEDGYCKKCGSSTYWEDCWDCGGEGGTDGEELMMEDPLWYSPDDFRKCDTCGGKGGWEKCLNSDCEQQQPCNNC